MAELWSTAVVHNIIAGSGRVVVETGTGAADAADTLTISLGTLGFSTFLGMTEHIFTTVDSVVVPAGTSTAGTFDISTTAVASGVLTITLGTGSDKKHVFEILGK